MNEFENNSEATETKNTEHIATYWYMRGYRNQSLQQKIRETLERGKLVDDSVDSCSNGVCD